MLIKEVKCPKAVCMSDGFYLHIDRVILIARQTDIVTLILKKILVAIISNAG